MKSCAWCVLTVVVGALAMQGCAQTETVRPDTSVATSPAPAAAPAATASAQGAAAIPQDANGKPVVAADNKEHFDAIAAAIRQQMQADGRFAFVTSSGRAKVNAGLNDMATLFDQYGSVDKMTPAAQATLLADQNAINEELARHDSDRRICWKETPVGTHFPKTVCRTLGEIQQQRENSNQYMQQTQQLQRQSQAAQAVGASNGH